MQKVLVFGGSFNPPTTAHEAIIRACLGLPQFDAVWVMPSGSRADKTIPMGDEHRLQMLRAVWRGSFASDPRLIVSDFELQLPRPTETRRTLRALATAYPNVEFWFAYGGDSYRDMASWPGANEFMPSIRQVVLGEHAVPASDRLVWLQLPGEVHDVSSTEVRAALAAGAATEWVSTPVREYIAAHGLYGARP